MSSVRSVDVCVTHEPSQKGEADETKSAFRYNFDDVGDCAERDWTN